MRVLVGGTLIDQSYTFSIRIDSICLNNAPTLTYTASLAPVTYTLGDPTLTINIANFVANVISTTCNPTITYSILVDG